MFIRPKVSLCDKKNYYRDAELTDELFYETGILLDTDEINLDFRKYYESYVFCSKNQLKKIQQCKVDVIIFSGYAGAGHFAPSRALAKKYESIGMNVVVIDLLNMISPLLSFVNCQSWLYVSRYNQDLFLKISEKIGREKSSDKMLEIFKCANIDFILDFIKSKNVKVCISTYLSANVIASKIAKHVNMFGVLLPDSSAVGMACELYKDTKNIVYFTINEETIEDAKLRYPYHKNTQNFVVTGAVPCFMEKRCEQQIYQNTLTWIIGGGMGIGYGIDGLETIIERHDGPIVIVCGSNKHWYNKVIDIKNTKYKDKKIFTFLYVSPESIKILMENSKIIIGKPGGSTFSEFISMSGYKIFYGTIKGHEQQNAAYCQSLELVRWCKNISELSQELKNPIYTESIYDKNIIRINPSDMIVNYTKKYL
jgi:UDP-N-acetylglucosamine:LPS N-acetylglucosamine transferase